jgi:pimeloyl-ACP methyl ester carboxylesterase
MNPLFIGTTQRRLFAIHEPPAARSGRPRAAVLCQPWGSEYIYAHRSMRHLAAQLAGASYHTLRFDYFGTGDSAGEPAEVDLAGCESDAGAAIEALKDISGASRVTLIGLRAGANVAAAVAGSAPDDVETLVLWDPIVSGGEHARELEAGPSSADAPRMLDDLRRIDFRGLVGTLPERSLVVMTQEPASREELQRRAAGGAAAIEFVAAPCTWIESVSITGALPVAALRRIQEWLR